MNNNKPAPFEYEGTAFFVINAEGEVMYDWDDKRTSDLLRQVADEIEKGAADE